MAMISVILNPNSCINQGSFKGDNMSPRCHSFGQVCFAKNKQEFSPRPPPPCRQTASASSSFVSPYISTSTKELDRPSSSLCLSQIWREVQGYNNWEDLLEPLHPLLRQEIIRYGEFLSACYKAFDVNPNSKRYLTCKYGKHNILKEVGLENSGYEVTKYIYATPAININIPIKDKAARGRWIGYVAVSKADDVIRKLGRKDILITFRGTVTYWEWIANMKSSLTPARLDPISAREEVQVESGFLSLYTSDETNNKFGLPSCREQLLSEVSRLLKDYKGEEISVSLAGHSMGSSLAVLLAYDIYELGLNKAGPDRVIPVTVFSFGGPRVGNLRFKARCEELGVKVLRIVNVHDPITKVPGVFLNEKFRVLGGKFELLPSRNFSCYAHVGVELELDFFNVQNPSLAHDLDAYIRMLKFPEAFEKIQNSDDIEFFNRFQEIWLNNSAQVLDALPLGDIATKMVCLVSVSKCLIEFLYSNGTRPCISFFFLFLDHLVTCIDKL